MEKAPNFRLPQIQSNTFYQLEDFLGKAVILTFWTSWCPDCQKDLPKKEHLYQTLNSEKVEMITINVAGRERYSEDAVDFYQSHLRELTLVDNGIETYSNFKAQGVPTTVIINKEGFIANRFGDKSEFLEIVEAIGKVI
ncbi:TlpA family protein disulfide reductase [Halobacillus andaensis]|uniref:TlpA family protein disulfide reductase n=1 Tax=Halobacillus andaensis TaxID=1176239 RepID=UPI003D720349